MSRTVLVVSVSITARLVADAGEGGATLADLLGLRRLGDVHRLVLSGCRPAAGRRRILHDVGTEGSLGDAERIRPRSGCLGDRLDRHEPVGGDASAKRRSPQGGSNKPSIVRRQRVVALWSHISVHNPSHNLLAALVL